MARDPIATWCFSLVVVRLGHRFLLVKERKHGQPRATLAGHSEERARTRDFAGEKRAGPGVWYLPAGRVEPGETFAAGALRETLEEAGIRIALAGILRVERSVQVDGTARMRVIYLGHPVDDTPPKSKPDDESLEAGWYSLEEMKSLKLRGAEVTRLFEAVEAGVHKGPPRFSPVRVACPRSFLAVARKGGAAGLSAFVDPARGAALVARRAQA